MSKRKLLSFHIKFVQTDRLTDRQTGNSKIICPHLSGHRHRVTKAYKERLCNCTSRVTDSDYHKRL